MPGNVKMYDPMGMPMGGGMGMDGMGMGGMPGMGGGMPGMGGGGMDDLDMEELMKKYGIDENGNPTGEGGEEGGETQADENGPTSDLGEMFNEAFVNPLSNAYDAATSWLFGSGDDKSDL